MSDVNQTTAQEGLGQNAPNTSDNSKLVVDAKDESSRDQEGRAPDSSNQSTNKSHAKDGGKASIVPKKLQEKLPESVERAVPNAIHDTGDTGGAHRKL
ncbi:hypothetical protein B0J13DRAFT_617219 [Dactylonectria estremocensis]|uniref:Uncharacterized protein n=1 Tax=Dactylonectria estremocensis TaxID=1079267 RepID=A0A9P9FES1_9HYPO|nr:hypothetical protein B0J13DRAFT_617219 [Dactylonectria estremocensis]